MRAWVLLMFGLVTVSGGVAADEPRAPPKPGFTTGRTPGFTTGRMPGFTTGPVSDVRAAYPVCQRDGPCVVIVEDDGAFDDEEREEDEELGTLEGDAS